MEGKPIKLKPKITVFKMAMGEELRAYLLKVIIMIG